MERRLIDYRAAIILISWQLEKKFEKDRFVVSQLDLQLNLVAPTFLDADSVLNYTTIVPILVMLFSATFCLGSSAIFHLWFVTSP